MAQCNVCFRHCEISEGETGFCGGRVCKGGKTEAGNYGRITSLALDPIEKKPLGRFFPCSMVLSVGGVGGVGAVNDDLVVRCITVIKQYGLDLRREYVDALDDEHIVGTAERFCHLDKCSSA